jgi:antitoxin component YwqK of YwqJK toxin-antitoxin module
MPYGFKSKTLRSIGKKRVYLPLMISAIKTSINCVLLLTFLMGLGACNARTENSTREEEDQPKMVKKYREDGTLSSLSPVDEEGMVHGVRVNLYEDGVTVHSKVTYEHGRKHGPAMWFFKNGRIYEHTTYYQNRRHGPTKRYYETGELYEETEYDSGEELPGKKRYTKEGKLIED